MPVRMATGCSECGNDSFEKHRKKDFTVYSCLECGHPNTRDEMVTSEVEY